MKRLTISFLIFNLLAISAIGATEKQLLIQKSQQLHGRKSPRVAKYTAIIYDTWKKNGSKLKHIEKASIPVALGHSESGLNPRAVSTLGCLGVFQLDPKTAIWICKKYGIPYNKKTIRRDLVNDVYFNILVGLYDLNYEISQSSDIKEAILSYKCGGNAIRSKVWYTSRENELYEIYLEKFEALGVKGGYSSNNKETFRYIKPTRQGMLSK